MKTYAINCLKCFQIYILGQTSPKKIRQENNLNYVKITWYSRRLLNLNKNRFYFFFFFSSSDKQKFYHVVGCHAIGMNSSLIFKCFVFFKFNIPGQKCDSNNSIRVMFIIVIININIIKIILRIPISLQENATLTES